MFDIANCDVKGSRWTASSSLLATHRDLARKMDLVEHTQKDHAAVLSIVVKDIQDLEKKVKRGFKNLRAAPNRRKPRFGLVADQPVAGPSKTRYRRGHSGFAIRSLLSGYYARLATA